MIRPPAAPLSGQVDNTPHTGIRVAILPDLLEVVERRLAGTVARRYTLYFIGVVQGGRDARHFLIGRSREVQPAKDGVHRRIYRAAAATIFSIPGCEQPATTTIPLGVSMASESSRSSLVPVLPK